MSDSMAKHEPSKEVITAVPSATFSTPVLQPSRLPSKYIRKQSVPIFVGPDRERYYVYKDLLAAKSPYFAAQFKQCWDGTKSEIELLEADQEAFELVIDWMYTDALPIRLSCCDSLDEYPWVATRRAYKLADQLMIPELQNKIMDAILASVLRYNLSWDIDEVKACAEEDLCHTPYYRLILRTYVRTFMTNPGIHGDGLRDSLQTLKDHPQALITVLTTIDTWNQNPWDNMLQITPCNYHIHDSGERCKQILKRTLDEAFDTNSA